MDQTLSGATLDDYAALATSSDDKILLLVLDGLGGLPVRPGGPTELEAARTPNLDELARGGMLGLHEPVGAGIAPGSGPGHLALFGYDPFVYRIGRGVLEALGVDFPLDPVDIAARGNLCTMDENGNIVDRRAGRISTEEARPLIERLDAIEVEGAETFVRVVKEHRFLLVLRPDSPRESDVADTDPGRPGLPPLRPEALSDASRETAALVEAWLSAARDLLAEEPAANTVVLRGFSHLPAWPRFPEVFGLKALAVAAYPMYRGVARLVGMEAVEIDDDLESLASAFEAGLPAHDFVFLHVKGTDKAGEDGDFDRKVAVIEEADALVPRLLDAGPSVVLVTGDHSTPAALRAHSGHPVPFLLWGGSVRPDEPTSFGESACLHGGGGQRPGRELLPLAVAAAGKLKKFGA